MNSRIKINLSFYAETMKSCRMLNSIRSNENLGTSTRIKKHLTKNNKRTVK